MRDEDQCAVEGGERPLQLLDRRQIEVIRRLVEDEAPGTARRLNRQLGTSPLAGRELSRRPENVRGVEVELGEQGSRFTRRQAGRGTE